MKWIPECFHCNIYHILKSCCTCLDFSAKKSDAEKTFDLVVLQSLEETGLVLVQELIYYSIILYIQGLG